MKNQYSRNRIPLWQLILLSVFTLGIYDTYWLFRTWKNIKVLQESQINPSLRTAGSFVPILNLFLLYNLFSRIFLVAKEKSVKRFHPALLVFVFPLVVGGIIYGLINIATDDGELLKILLVQIAILLPIVLAQHSLNLIDDKDNARKQKLVWSKNEIVLCTLLVFYSAIPSFTIAAIRLFALPLQIEGNDNSDSLLDGEYVLSNKFTYFMGTPQRGDMVVFRPPNEPTKFYIKRVIGEPGDEVIIRGGNVFLREGGQGEEVMLDEAYLDERNAGQTYRHPPGSGDTSEVRYDVPAGNYFMMGDNRQGSLDSRSFSVDGEVQPYVTEDDIKGKVWFVALPISKTGNIPVPHYNL